jgi:hypothetical protein
MTVSRAFLERCAGETGYPPVLLEKVVRLGEMATAVRDTPVLRRALLLKGGTPLNLAFGSPGRLSVDLDYNYVGAADREAMPADRPDVEGAVISIAERLGYRVQQSADEFAGRKFYLSYQSALGGSDRIEVDLSYLFRVPIELPQEQVIWQPGGLDAPAARMVSTTELIVGKALALLDRAAPRDAWDIARLPPPIAGELQSPRLQSCFIALSAILDHPLLSYGLTRMEGLLTQRFVTEQLVPMLTAGRQVDAGDLAREAWAAVEPLLELSPGQHEYLESIERGVARTNLLFPDDPERAGRAAGHPAIQWKLRNVRLRLGLGE